MLLNTLEQIKNAWEKALALNYPDKKYWLQTALANIFSLNTGWYLDKLPEEVPGWEKWLAETALLMKKSYNGLITYMNMTIGNHEIQWITDDWTSHRELCLLRSQLEFLMETYQDFLSEDEIAGFELESFDQQLRELQSGGTIPDAFVPAGVPETHWWWYPGSLEK